MTSQNRVDFVMLEGKEMTKEKLREILDKHDKWLKGQNGGERADLSFADLSHIDLSGTNLTRVNLANAYLIHTNLSGTDLTHANLSGAFLAHANLASADLTKTNLTSADLTNANLADAYLADADLSDADYTNTLLNPQCPEEGSFIAWKKLADRSIAKLFIPEDAKRSSATSRKCRASKAVVLAIYSRDGKEINEDRSIYNTDFIYRVGETVYPDSWDENRWNECSNGIHFFITRKEAKEY